MFTVFPKGYIYPIVIVRLLICVFNGLDMLDKCLHIKLPLQPFNFYLLCSITILDVFRKIH